MRFRAKFTDGFWIEFEAFTAENAWSIAKRFHYAYGTLYEIRMIHFEVVAVED